MLWLQMRIPNKLRYNILAVAHRLCRLKGHPSSGVLEKKTIPNVKLVSFVHFVSAALPKGSAVLLKFAASEFIVALRPDSSKKLIHGFSICLPF